MKQEDLLFKDICARLPYKVKVSYYDNETERQECDIVDSMYEDTQEIGVGQWCLKMDKFKPYLFPMSSMTEEQKRDLLLTIVEKKGLKLFSVTKDGIISNDKAEQSFENFSLNSINFSNENIEAYIDWLNKNHFDYRGLIQKGLAIDATGLNIY